MSDGGRGGRWEGIKTENVSGIFVIKVRNLFSRTRSAPRIFESQDTTALVSEPPFHLHHPSSDSSCN